MGCKNCKKKREEMTPEKQTQIMKRIWVAAIIFSGFAAYGFYTALKELWTLIT
tara:strand:+ start:678 stop:836 length:159 start_codon:yes stop_codon:yes gene_type:complete